MTNQSTVFRVSLCLLLVNLFSCSFMDVNENQSDTQKVEVVATESPVYKHGALRVDANKIVNQYGRAPMLAGPSFFWSNTGWEGAEFYRSNVVDYFVQDWNASIVRAAIGVKPSGGYLQDPKANIKRAEIIIDAAIQQGVYVILDFHSHEAEDYVPKAKEFFTYFASKYAAYDNIIYEIYNEPLRETDWESVIKPYSIELIETIRQFDPDNLIIVGTQSWSQDVDIASRSPINAYKNIAYSLHFYAGTHKQELRDKAKVAIENGLPIMVTEWGGVNANGDGAVDKKSVAEWVKFMRDNQLSHMNWSVSQKREGASMFKPGTKPRRNLSDADLTESGLLVKEIVKNWSLE